MSEKNLLIKKRFQSTTKRLIYIAKEIIDNQTKTK